MRRIATWWLALLTAAGAAAAEQKIPGGGMVYGKELAVTVAAPRGWVYDASSGAGQGLGAVMYPEGSSWKAAAEVIYVSVVPLAAGQTLAAYIADDLARYREKASDLAVETSEPIAQEVGDAKVEVRLCTTDAGSTYEAVAYAHKGSSVAVYVLSCKTRAALAKTLPAFRGVVSNSDLLTVAQGR